MRYEIDQNNAIRVYQDGENVPFLYQPAFPNQTPFDSKEEAQEWAELYIASMTDETAPYAPIGRGLVGEPQPSKEELAQMLAEFDRK